MTSFSKPSRSRIDPEAADAFIAGADVGPANAVAVRLPPPTEQRPLRFAPPSDATNPAPSPEREPEVASQTIRFEADEKEALELLARVEDRSQHKIIKRLLRPVLLAAAEKAKRDG